LEAEDVDGDSLYWDDVGQPQNGYVSGIAPNLIYQPDQDFTGIDSFEFRVFDGEFYSEYAIISILVHESTCLVVDPSSLELTLLQDTSDSLPLSITNNCSIDVSYEIVEASPPDSELLLDEGFEGSQMPPVGGWEISHDGETSYEWEIKDDPAMVHQGQHAAWVTYDDNQPSDEWLITPVIDMSTSTRPALTFWALSDTNYPGATMKVWALDENNQKLSPEPLWDMVQDESWGSWGYRFVLIDLREYSGQDQFRIGWEYVGQGGQSFGLDAIRVGNSTDVGWVSSSPMSSTIIGSGTQEVIVNFDALGLAGGDHFASLLIDNYPYPSLQVPITLHVEGDDQFLFIPLIIR
jgi:hypothetical protein